MAQARPMLEIDSLDVFYGAVHALKGVNLLINEGEIIALIGSNGAGKSTALKCISGLVRPARGRIRFMGRDITGMEASQIVSAGISHCPEGRQVFAGLTVLENLVLGAYLRKDKGVWIDMERVFEVFPVLAERRNQIAGTLSGGEQEMLAIGRALMSRPRLLMLDEPSLGLAPMVMERIFETIREINQQGTTVLLVEQNAFMALEIAARGYVLETGRLVIQGSAVELMGNPDVRRAYLGG